MFYIMWFVIVAISVHDGFLVFQHRYLIGHYEQNPWGKLLLNWNDGDIWLMLAVKALGTIAVAGLLLVMKWRSQRKAWYICAALCAFQISLLVYLSTQ